MKLFLCRSSTALPVQSQSLDDLAKVVVIPEHDAPAGANRSNTTANGIDGTPPPAPGRPSFPFRLTKRKRAAESILSSIRRHYATVVDVASYVGLGLVLYAGRQCMPLPARLSANADGRTSMQLIAIKYMESIKECSYQETKCL